MKKILMIAILLVISLTSICFASKHYISEADITVTIPTGFKILDHKSDNSDLVNFLNGDKIQKYTKEQYIEQNISNKVFFYAYDLRNFSDISIVVHVPQSDISLFEPIFNGSQKEVPDRFKEETKKYFKKLANWNVTDMHVRDINNTSYLELIMNQEYMYIKSFIAKKGEKIITFVFQTMKENKNFYGPKIIDFIKNVEYGKISIKEDIPQNINNNPQYKVISNTPLPSRALYDGVKGALIAAIACAIVQIYRGRKNNK